MVSVKQVPDTTEVRIDPRTNTLVREGVPSIVNPDDLHAVEAAVNLKEHLGGQVTVITMGPPQAEKSLRRALSLGADRAVLVSDRAFAAADTFATTYVLDLAIRRLHGETPVDLVLCGKQALDGDTGQVGPGLARRLGWPLLAYATAIRRMDPATGEIVVERRLDGAREVLEARLPCLITVLPEINSVRYAALPDLLRSQQAEITRWSAADLDADPARVGLRGSPTRVARSFVPPPRRQDVQMIPGAARDPRLAAERLVDLLMERGVPGLQKDSALEDGAPRHEAEKDAVDAEQSTARPGPDEPAREGPAAARQAPEPAAR